MTINVHGSGKKYIHSRHEFVNIRTASTNTLRNSKLERPRVHNKFTATQKKTHFPSTELLAADARSSSTSFIDISSFITSHGLINSSSQEVAARGLETLISRTVRRECRKERKRERERERVKRG